jgi:hypothetical protein
VTLRTGQGDTPAKKATPGPRKVTQSDPESDGKGPFFPKTL